MPTRTTAEDCFRIADAAERRGELAWAAFCRLVGLRMLFRVRRR